MDQKMSIMVVDDEMIVRESLYHWFRKYLHEVDTAASGTEAIEKMGKKTFDMMFVDIKMPGMDGIELLARIKQDYPETLVIIITAYGSIETAVKAMKMGASDYLLKPFKPDQLALVMEKIVFQKRLASEYQYLKNRLAEVTRFDNIIGQSPAMLEVFEMITEVARSDATVLITGETGTGKELVAKAIHAKSGRSHCPFIAINCGALPDSLLESELFGYQKGAFTGAAHPRKGFFEVVGGGTLFLDEIGEVSVKMQVDLLRVLEERQITRLGETRPVAVDFRLISATRRDLPVDVRAGRFREDLFYRINVITIKMPPLRGRRGDIPLLVAHFLDKYCHETTKQVDRVDPGALAFLKAYPWPGNVRELENAMERAVVLSKSRTLKQKDFAFLKTAEAAPVKARALRDVEKAHVEKVLVECGWNVTRAAGVLDINRVTLHRMIKRYGLERAR